VAFSPRAGYGALISSSEPKKTYPGPGVRFASNECDLLTRQGTPNPVPEQPKQLTRNANGSRHVVFRSSGRAAYGRWGTHHSELAMGRHSRLLERQLRAMLDVLDEARHGEYADEPMRALVTGLGRLVPCDDRAFSEIDIAKQQVLVDFGAEPAYDSDDDPAESPYWTWRHQHPVCTTHERFGAAAGVLQLADFVSARQLHHMAIYQELFHPVQHVMAMPLPTAPGRTRVFQFFREDRTPFSELDRMILTLLQPHIYAIYGEAAQRAATAKLTDGELQVIRCVATGMSNSQIARHLAVSPSTVRKHLENAFQRLGVQSRTAAVARISQLDNDAAPPNAAGPPART
jgi:DNA-binding CsgD family transcriptional regulator